MVSDATGETLNVLMRAAVAQFADINVREHVHALIRTRRQLDRAIHAIETTPGLVMYTIMDLDLSDALERACRNLGVPCIAPLDPVIAAFRTHFGREAMGRPGAQHELDRAYFDRIEALNYTMAHDDGALPDDLNTADVVLIGVSRTSKTPTAIYLAHRGVKVVNIPLVPSVGLPNAVGAARTPLIVGLTADAEHLAQIRRNRLKAINDDRNAAYADIDAVAEEVRAARRLFSKHGWPAIDVTRRSIEETAASILSLLEKRRQSAAK